jgi:hypothetical protein
LSIAEFAGAIPHAQSDFGFPQRPPRSTPHPRVRAKRREADWRRQLARAFVYATGQHPEAAAELLAEYESREREGPEWLRQRPGSIVTEAPRVNLDRNALARLAVKFRAICRNSWKTKAPGKHRGAISRVMEAAFLALMYLARKDGRISLSFTELGRLAMANRGQVIESVAELENLGFVTRIRRLREVYTALGFKTVQDTNAYLVHEPTKGLGLIATRMFCPESDYPPARETYDSSLEHGERYGHWLDPDSRAGLALAAIGAGIMREN